MDPLKFDPLKMDEDFFIKQTPGAEKAKVKILRDENGVRYGFLVDVSEISSAEAQDYLQRVKDELKKKRFKEPPKDDSH